MFVAASAVVGLIGVAAALLGLFAGCVSAVIAVDVARARKKRAPFVCSLIAGFGHTRAPVELLVDGRYLRVRIRGMDRLWAFHGGFTVPLAHVASVEAAVDEAAQGPRAVFRIGTWAPGLVVAGSYIVTGSYLGIAIEFWDVHDARNAVALRLWGERFARIVVEVDDPGATIAAIRAVI